MQRFRVSAFQERWHEVLYPATRHAVRLLISIASAWGVSLIFHLQETTWALVTALIVTQTNITDVVLTARDQIVGTILGAFASTIAITLEMWTEMKWLPFWLVLIPLAFLASVKKRLRFACVTLMIVYLFPSYGNPFSPMIARLTAIMVGVIVSLIVSYLVFHRSARRQAFSMSSCILRRLAQLLKFALDAEVSWYHVERRAEACIPLIIQLEQAVEDAKREHFIALEKRDPVLVTLPKIMRRLLNDTMLVARALSNRASAETADILFLYKGLSHTLRVMAYSCDQRFVHKPNRYFKKLKDKDILTELSKLEEQNKAEVRFAMSLFKEDLERALRIIVHNDVNAVQEL
ncbi:FUSC family protein [Swingsia samuiensis]|uniref:FUSC family protein n=1 Tax=Swingsia samuiensis TaxID=1293412 RepID=UPI001FECB5E2|nr:FUSC family protein [Swingsia samuiensis]